ncbi:alpha-hydroxyketone-type quorum-sensing autoinducer synthase [Photobacterium sagamiensis]|uniref:alpha-hydroxyketone-type quorum-sensing autoinducer synthase n=1 Tax=Photobacterium sagamiensis TaxID=2910241 RepID=UPI003D09DD5D
MHKKKVDHHLNELINPRKNKKHLVLGKKPTEGAVLLQSNDYLAISNHDAIRNAQIDALIKTDKEVVMSAIFLHKDGENDSFEQQLASFTGYEHCILSQSGWAANIGLIQTIIPANTPVYIDFFAHMSLWEGARTANAAIHTFLHNNVKHLEKMIKKHGPGLILVDSVYSTLGTIAPITEIVAIAKKYGCATLVDESHSLGTHGLNGSGLVAELGLTNDVDFITVSLAKSFAYRAGAILCSDKVGQCFPFVAHPAIFSSALLPHEVEVLKATLDLIKKSDQRRKQLFSQTSKLKNGLEELGYRIQSQSQIIALETGSEARTEVIRDLLEADNIFGSVFCQPATPKNRNLIRFSVNSSLSDDDIGKILLACDKVRGVLNK